MHWTLLINENHFPNAMTNHCFLFFKYTTAIMNYVSHSWEWPTQGAIHSSPDTIILPAFSCLG